MRTILEAVEESFVFIGTTEAAAEIENGIIIFQRKGAEKFFQFLKSFADFQWVGFVGFCVGLVQLIQDGFAI